MESRSAARGRAAWAVRNHLLSDRKAHLRQCRSCTRRIFPAPGSVAGSATETARQANKFVADHCSATVAALCEYRTRTSTVQIRKRGTNSRFFTGITFVFCGPFSFRAIEAIKVPAPHDEKQSKTTVIFFIKLTD